MAAGVPAHRIMVVHEERELPDHFALAGTPSPDTPISLKIALTATDMAGLEKVVWDVSTPGNSLYGQHLSYDETRAYAVPSPETVSAVATWLNENGITNLTSSGAFDDWLGFTVPISIANSLLNANFEKFSEVGGPRELTRTLSYSIPVDLKQHIDLVYPTTDFVRLSKGPKLEVHETSDKLATRAIAASCQSAVIPQCLQNLYGIPTTPATNSLNTLFVSGFDDEWAQEEDLEEFLSIYRTDIRVPLETTFQEKFVDGGENPQAPLIAGIEADLDTQYTVGIATNVSVTFISVGDNNTDGDLDGFLDLANYLLNQTTTPGVLTTSYGFNEGDVTLASANNLCNAYLKLTARGTSILFSSGDGGVSGSQNQSCTTFVPTFPSTCPYVTSVGSTNLTVAGNPTETAATFSAGGFSNYFPTPAYQKPDVPDYLTGLNDAYKELYNSSGRGYPDVSTLGVNFQIVVDSLLGIVPGLTLSVDGTSCSSPTFASIIALINDRLLEKEKPRLGFLNPLLYSFPKVFNDITTGSNPGCGTPGFPAKVGWDPVTGLGTPNFTSLLQTALDFS